MKRFANQSLMAVSALACSACAEDLIAELAVAVCEEMARDGQTADRQVILP